MLSVGDDFAVLDSDAHNLAVPVEAITRMQVLDLPLRVHVKGAGDEADAKVPLGMAYLRQGITWVPEYTLRIVDDQTAELTLRGTVINEAEDLIHCDVHFVVGVPHFVHSDRLAPLAIGQAIRAIGASIVPDAGDEPDLQLDGFHGVESFGRLQWGRSIHSSRRRGREQPACQPAEAWRIRRVRTTRSTRNAT